MTDPKIFGLTGGIGSGKSTVAKLFATHGVPCLDADDIARKLREPGKAGHAAILKQFGTVDRSALRELISKDPSAKQTLESILHPLIKTESDLALKKLKQENPSAPFILYEAALLIEAGRIPDFDGLIMVTAPEHLRIKRIMARDQSSLDQATRLVSTQLSDEERAKFAQYIIQNDGTAHELAVKVQKVLDQIICAC